MKKEFRSKTEKVFSIVSLVCVAAIIFGFLCVKLGLLTSLTGYLIVGHGVFYGLITIPVFICRRFNRLTIYADRVFLPSSFKRVIHNGKGRISSKSKTIYFSDIVSIKKKVARSYDVIGGELSTDYFEFCFKNGDVLDECFMDLSEEDMDEVVEWLTYNIKNKNA